MKKTFNKINLQPSIPEIYPLRVKFQDEEYIYDFSLFGDNEISRLFAKAFYDRNISLTNHTRGRNFGSINKFFQYAKSINLNSVTEINPVVIVGFATWLDNQEFSLNTKYHHYNTVENSLYDIKKINSSIADLEIPINPFKSPNSERASPNKLTSEQLKEVLSICYQRVDELINNFQIAQKKIEEVKAYLSNGGEFNWKDKYHIIYHFSSKYGYVPFSTEVNNHEKEMFRNIGGVNHLLNAITPDVHMLLPFYLILMVELAANSDALRQIKIDCIKEDPLFNDRCFIVWNKGRSSEQQKRNVFKNKKFGAFQIIEMIKEITQHTRKFISESDKEFLFICRGEMAKKPFLGPHEQGFKWALDFFCKTNKLDFNFNPSDIRPTVLTEIYKKRKDIVAVSKIANHKFIDTTLLYIVDDETKKENRAYLSEKQNNIFENILKTQQNENSIDVNNAENVGFSCKNPIVNKKVCINWMAELTNPELVIPENPIYLSKIISLKDAINDSEKLMDKERFNLLYMPILEVISQQILVKFSKKIINEAEALAKNIKTPLLGEY